VDEQPIDWRAMFLKYADIVADAEGVTFLQADPRRPDSPRWTPTEWAAIDKLYDTSE
jgi:hypothetical protein